MTSTGIIIVFAGFGVVKFWVLLIYSLGGLSFIVYIVYTEDSKTLAFIKVNLITR